LFLDAFTLNLSFCEGSIILSDTAIGKSEVGWNLLWLDLFNHAADREIIYEDEEWDALNLQGIRCWPRTQAG
jgi:hypothetical protein